MSYSNTEIGALADAFGKSIKTIERWIAAEDVRLVSDYARNVIKSLKESKNAKK